MKHVTVAVLIGLVWHAVAQACPPISACRNPSPPAIPALVSPQDPAQQGADPTGVVDATQIFQNIWNGGHDIDITTPGTYKILSVASGCSGGRLCANGHQLRCGDGSWASGHNGAYKISSPTTAAENVIYSAPGTHLVVDGCQFVGINANATSRPTFNNVSQTFIYWNESTGSSLSINNWFNGIGGFNAAELFDGHGANIATGITSTCNTYSWCGLRAHEVDAGKNLTINYNDEQDCPDTPEIQTADQEPLVNILFDNNHLTYFYGNAASGFSLYAGHFGDYEGCGWANHLGAGGVSYAGCTFSNNIIRTQQGFGPIDNWMVEAVFPNSSGVTAIGTYTNNSCTGDCSVH